MKRREKRMIVFTYIVSGYCILWILWTIGLLIATSLGSDWVYITAKEIYDRFRYSFVILLILLTTPPVILQEMSIDWDIEYNREKKDIYYKRKKLCLILRWAYLGVLVISALLFGYILV